MPPKRPAPNPKTTRATAAKPGAKPAVKSGSRAPPVGRNAPVKKTSVTKPGQKGKTAPKPTEKKPTKEDLAAIVIQKHVRGFLAKVKLDNLKNKKAEYEELIEKLQHQAYIDMVNAEREESDRQYEREMAARKKIAAEKKRIKKFLECSFDDEVDSLKGLVKEVLRTCDEDGIDTDEIGQIKRDERVFKLIECEDANENTALSEAAAGGAVQTIKFLLEYGADPNTIGHFGRTPLYRAVFGGHVEAINALLSGGADPTIKATDLNTPDQITSDQAILDIFTNWNISDTESILAQREKAVEARNEKSRKRRENETQQKENTVRDIEQRFENAKLTVTKLHCELEKRIVEHDKAVATGFERIDVTEGAINQAEIDLESARLRLDQVRTELQMAKLALREQEQSNSNTSLYCGIKCNIRELDDVLFKDVGNKIQESGKGLIVLTELGRSKQAATFLRYRDTNYFHILSDKEMSADNLRTGLLGSIRYGKLCIIDFDNMDMFDALKTFLNNIKPDLFDAILSKQVINEEYYSSMVKPGDNKDYQKSGFNRSRVIHYKFVVLMKTAPDDHWLDITYPIQIVPSNSA